MGARRAKAAIVFFCLLLLDFSPASQAPLTPKRPEQLQVPAARRQGGIG
jgi:hypothetical protein